MFQTILILFLSCKKNGNGFGDSDDPDEINAYRNDYDNDGNLTENDLNEKGHNLNNTATEPQSRKNQSRRSSWSIARSCAELAK